MSAKQNTNTLERGLRQLALGDTTTDGYRIALRRRLQQQATNPTDAAIGQPVATTSQAQQSRSEGLGWRPAAVLRLLPRWGVVLAGALLVIALVGTSYATEPIINRLFDRSADTNQPLGTAFNLSQTVNGYTMTLQRAYADRRFIIVGYTITGVGGRPVNGVQPVASGRLLNDPTVSSFPILTDDQGHEISPLGGGGYSATQTNAITNTYSGAGIPPGASRITLHLEAGAMQVPQPDHSLAMVSGRWAFTFTVPVAPSRIAQPQQTVADANGWPVTLERVSITPTQVSVVLRGAGTEAGVELIAGGNHYSLQSPGGASGRAFKECLAEGSQCPELWKSYTASYGDSADILDGHVGAAATWMKQLAQEKGAWTLVVRASPQPGKLSQPQGGPWIFHFTMP